MCVYNYMHLYMDIQYNYYIETFSYYFFNCQGVIFNQASSKLIFPFFKYGCYETQKYLTSTRIMPVNV